VLPHLLIGEITLEQSLVCTIKEIVDHAGRFLLLKITNLAGVFNIKPTLLISPFNKSSIVTPPPHTDVMEDGHIKHGNIFNLKEDKID